MQSLLGIDTTDEEKLVVYAEFLKERGYIVIPPKSLDRTSVKNAVSLVDLFYSLLQYHNQHRKIHYAKASKKDLGMARQFIKHREEVCGGKVVALQECASIVKCVVENEGLFCFSMPLRSFDCFGNDSMKWVVDRAISIINEENHEVSEKEMALFTLELSNKQEKESLMRLEDKIQDLKKILGETQDGD